MKVRRISVNNGSVILNDNTVVQRKKSSLFELISAHIIQNLYAGFPFTEHFQVLNLPLMKCAHSHNHNHSWYKVSE